MPVLNFLHASLLRDLKNLPVDVQDRKICAIDLLYVSKHRWFNGFRAIIAAERFNATFDGLRRNCRRCMVNLALLIDDLLANPD
jgi:hypothetical protein